MRGVSAAGSPLEPASVRDRLREHGLRWTPQRRAILEVLASTAGHVTAAELVERCHVVDPDVTASTVYRTLDTLEDLGLIVHSHGRDGREEYHVVPGQEHAHLVCERCGSTWEVGPADVAPVVEHLDRARGFAVSVGHLSISGLCAACRSDAKAPQELPTPGSRSSGCSGSSRPRRGRGRSWQ